MILLNQRTNLYVGDFIRDGLNHYLKRSRLIHIEENMYWQNYLILPHILYGGIDSICIMELTFIIMRKIDISQTL